MQESHSHHEAELYFSSPFSTPLATPETPLLFLESGGYESGAGFGCRTGIPQTHTSPGQSQSLYMALSPCMQPLLSPCVPSPLPHETAFMVNSPLLSLPSLEQLDNLQFGDDTYSSPFPISSPSLSPFSIHPVLFNSPLSASSSPLGPHTPLTPSSDLCHLPFATTSSAASPYSNALGLHGDVQPSFGQECYPQQNTPHLLYSPPTGMPDLLLPPSPHPSVNSITSRMTSLSTSPELFIESLDRRGHDVSKITFRQNGQMGVSLREAMRDSLQLDKGKEAVDCFMGSRKITLKIQWPGYHERGGYIATGRDMTRAQLASKIAHRVVKFMRHEHKQDLKKIDERSPDDWQWNIQERHLRPEDILLQSIDRISSNTWVFKPNMP